MIFAFRPFLPLIALFLIQSCRPGSGSGSGPFDPVPFNRVTINDDFWTPKIDSNRINGIPGCFAACDYSLVNFDIAAGRSNAAREGTLASDSDVYKIIQGVAHALDHEKDAKLEAFTDSLIERIAAAQEPDGYLNTYFTILFPEEKWVNVEQKHELYCAGHLFEAAAEYYQVTGKRRLLDVAVRLADHIDRKFGIGKLEEVSGHEEIELALMSLYDVTGEKKYLDLASFFLEERGNPQRLLRKTQPIENDPNENTPKRFRKPEYRQDHLPVKDQRKAVGHAVRAAYLYCGMADMALETGSEEYLPALISLSNDIITSKIYVTGATGTSEYKDEGFGSGSLKNSEAYCETCASIALMLWNFRMTGLTGESKYADLFELTLYNGGLSGVSLAGNRFFYENPLESEGNDHRDEWFEPGCCPSNMVRFIPQIDRFIYGQKENRIYINQFIGSSAEIMLPAGPVNINQTTGYPRTGKVMIQLGLKKTARLAINIRIPAWIRGEFFPGGLYEYAEIPAAPLQAFSVRINGIMHEYPIRRNGFLEIRRKWQDNDEIEIEFEMPVNLVKGNTEIKDVTGKSVLTRGPMVYCLESVDNPELFSEPEAYTLVDQSVQSVFKPQLLGGIHVITGTATSSDGKPSLIFTAIPYYAWCNRGPAAMRVWW